MDGRAARERLERARAEWLVAYRERERAVLEELARAEDSHIEEVFHGMRTPLERPFVEPRAAPLERPYVEPRAPSPARSRSRERRGDVRRARKAARRAAQEAPPSYMDRDRGPPNMEPLGPRELSIV